MSDLHELLAERTRLEKEHCGILEQIRELRKRAREKTIIAADTRQPLDPTEVEFWQRGIKENQTLLMKAQAELGALNKAIRATQAADTRPAKDSGARDRPTRENDDDGETVFLSCFHTICKDSLDPRQFAALEAGAHSLARDYRQMHKEEGHAR